MTTPSTAERINRYLSELEAIRLRQAIVDRRLLRVNTERKGAPLRSELRELNARERAVQIAIADLRRGE